MSFTDKLKKFTNDAVEKGKGLAEQGKLSIENQKQLDTIKRAQLLIGAYVAENNLLSEDEYIMSLLSAIAAANEVIEKNNLRISELKAAAAKAAEEAAEEEACCCDEEAKDEACCCEEETKDEACCCEEETKDEACCCAEEAEKAAEAEAEEAEKPACAFCPDCGKEVDPDARFCPYCGKALK